MLSTQGKHHPIDRSVPLRIEIIGADYVENDIRRLLVE
jgi:hypothetical protein